ncbi:hypothetical protein [Salinimicrobium sediminilitoris]|nr:hypothetical protein [Salinimicrobium sediminilitoris]
MGDKDYYVKIVLLKKVFFRTAAIKFTTSSGADCTNATFVRPITLIRIERTTSILEAASSNFEALKMRAGKSTIGSNKVMIL